MLSFDLSLGQLRHGRNLLGLFIFFLPGVSASICDRGADVHRQGSASRRPTRRRGLSSLAASFCGFGNRGGGIGHSSASELLEEC
jgi:hypothetical protein